jgi:hypothetical protein
VCVFVCVCLCVGAKLGIKFDGFDDETTTSDHADAMTWVDASSVRNLLATY